MSLKARINLAVVAIILLVAVTTIVTGSISRNQIEERFEEATQTGKQVLWRKIILIQYEHMQNGSSSLIRDRATRKALRARDTEKLAESAQTTFNLLNASHVLDRMQLTDVDGNVLFSAPSAFSGKTRKTLVQKALSEGKIVSGLERDDDGKLMASVAFPLSIRGKKIGVGVFSSQLDHAIEDFKASEGSDVFIVNDNGALEYATDAEIFKDLEFELPAPGESELSTAKHLEHVYSVSALPLFNPQGEAVAHMVTTRDYTESYATQQTFTVVTYAVLVLIIMGSVAASAWYLGRSFRPLRNVVRNLKQISEGDLTVEIDVTSQDEIGQLQEAMGNTVEQLNHLIGQVNNMTSQLSAASDQMGTITEETRHGVIAQQSELEQVATAMNEMTATVQEVATHANQAAEAASKADSEAQQGSDVVGSTIASINSLAQELESAAEVVVRLQSNSDDITRILDVIRDIAEQTNLLALNAAIEAARAGDQGRGFAVVADEVRTLASRTQESTEEIHKMIEQLQAGSRNAVSVMQNSRDRAQDSVDHAAKAGESLQAINQAVNSISEMNLQIASAAEEQTSVADEINKNITEISGIAERTALGAEQNARASESLTELAGELTQVVGKFRV